LLSVGQKLCYFQSRERTVPHLRTNWSITLEVREQHRLITHGVYRRVRHPMYASLQLYSVGQALALPNWVAGPSYLVAFVILSRFVSAPRSG